MQLATFWIFFKCYSTAWNRELHGVLKAVYISVLGYLAMYYSTSITILEIQYFCCSANVTIPLKLKKNREWHECAEGHVKAHVHYYNARVFATTVFSLFCWLWSSRFSPRHYLLLILFFFLNFFILKLRVMIQGLRHLIRTLVGVSKLCIGFSCELIGDSCMGMRVSFDIQLEEV